MMNMTTNDQQNDKDAQNLSNVIGLGLSDIHQTDEIYFNSQQNPLEMINKVRQQALEEQNQPFYQEYGQVQARSLPVDQRNDQGVAQDLNPSLATLISTLTICKDDSRVGKEFKQDESIQKDVFIQDRYAQKECFLYTFFTNKLKTTISNIFKNGDLVSSQPPLNQ